MEQYLVQRKLGEGGFGEAYLVKSSVSGRAYVMKKIMISTQNDLSAALKEIGFLKSLTHPNIVGYRDAYQDGNYMAIIMEFCQQGDLSQQIANRYRRRQAFPEQQILTWFRQVCSAVQFVHDRGILHRDIKPQNIFLTAGNDVKLGDFGIAKQLTQRSAGPNVSLTAFYKAETVIGTALYLAPEVLRQTPYDKKCDVWSLGCVLYELITRQPAFYDHDLEQLAWKIINGPSPKPAECSELLQRLVSKMLTKSPGARPSIDAVIQEMQPRHGAGQGAAFQPMGGYMYQ